MNNFYDVLGVSPNAPLQQIKKAYRILVKRYHPDHNRNFASATQQTQCINEAYATLSDSVKRHEYDNLLRLEGERGLGTTHETDSPLDAATPTEVPRYSCEMCGRQDPTLRFTVFLWVVSLLFVSWKRGWGRILCSRCRIKYSVLWNLEVWFAGWWGIPFGPVFSIGALYKNSTGGEQPRENNATLLDILALDFHRQGRYNDAFDALQESRRLNRTAEKNEFWNLLRRQIRPKQTPTLFERLFSTSPAYYNIPLLAVLLLGSIILSLSVDLNSPQSPARSFHYVPTLKKSRPPPEVFANDVSELAPKLGISLDELNNAGNVCNEAIAKVAFHIKSRVTFTRAIGSGSTSIRQYELDRDNLDQRVVGPWTDAIHSQMCSTSRLLAGLQVPDSISLTGDAKAKLGLRGFLLSQHEAMVASYFNCAILEYSIPLVQSYRAHEVLPSSYVSQVRQLGKQPDVAAWLARSHYGRAYRNLISVISVIRTRQAHIAGMKTRLDTLRAQMDDDQSTMTSWQQKLREFQAEGKTEAYKRLLLSYGSRQSSARQHFQDYGTLIGQLNRSKDSTNGRELDRSFNDCLDPHVLFADFEKVDNRSTGGF